LWFWSGREGFYYQGKWSPQTKRPSLHRTIYERSHGPVPAGCVVVHLDGNKNNLDPANLALRTRNDICRQNQARAIAERSRKLTGPLLHGASAARSTSTTNASTKPNPRRKNRHETHRLQTLALLRI
jgi:hypothetical protein